MSSPQTTNKNPVAPERLAEAGVWIARLHGGNRTRAIELGLKRWLREDPENTRAFEIATEVWDDAENLRQFVALRPKWSRRPRSSMAPIFAAAAMASVLLLLGAVLWFQNLGVITTGVGEQRQLVLEDGTRVYLNTDTQLVVKYTEETRRVELRRGEALFNVAKRAAWPFVVVAGDRQVRALGTSFVVRKEDRQLAVMLVEGQVVVSPVVDAKRSAARAAARAEQRFGRAECRNTSGGSGAQRRLHVDSGSAPHLRRRLARQAGYAIGGQGDGLAPRSSDSRRNAAAHRRR
jgi:transmembrane sensor